MLYRYNLPEILSSPFDKRGLKRILVKIFFLDLDLDLDATIPTRTLGWRLLKKPLKKTWRASSI